MIKKILLGILSVACIVVVEYTTPVSMIEGLIS